MSDNPTDNQSKQAEKIKLQSLKILKRHMQTYESLKSDRANWESWWEQILYYVIPRKRHITTEGSSGEQLPKDIYDSTAILSNQILAAGLHGYLTNPASPWFSLKTRDRELMKSKAVKIWFSDAEKKVYDTLNSTNFNQEIHEFYLDLGSVGTAVLYAEEDDIDMVIFHTRHIKEVYLQENAKGFVDTIYRVFEFTAQQAFETWGERAGQQIMKALQANKGTKKFPFLHVIEPRIVRNVNKKDNINKPIASFYYNLKEKSPISESGYDEFPVMATRFTKVSTHVYGYCPSMNTLPDIRMLNSMCQTNIRAAQKIVDPPLDVPHDGYLLPLSSGPGGINYRMQGTAQDRIMPIQTGGNIPLGLELEDRRREIIKKAFFVDLFMALADKKNMTATEVQERVAEKMLILGPTLGRLMTELLDPLISRTVNILTRKGLIPPPPQELSGVEYTIEYVSPLAKAQKQAEVSSVTNFLGIIGQIAQVDPSIIDMVDSDESVRIIADALGVPPKVIRDKVELETLRKQKQQMQEKQMQMQQLQQGADIASTAASAEKDLAKAKK